MRVLISCISGTGHFHPLVPMARALTKAGHEVAFAIAGPFVPTVEANGFRAFAAGIGFESLGFDPKEMMQRQEALRSAPIEVRLEMTGSIFIDKFMRNKVPDLLALFERWRPDLVLRESADLSSALVAEKLGIPQASLQVGGANPMAEKPELFAQRLNGIRAEYGLGPTPDLAWLTPWLHLSFMPAEYFTPPLPPQTRYLKLEVFDQSGTEGLPAWVEALGERPVVYATLGTVFNKQLEPLKAIIEGLRDEPLELILTVGRDQDPAQLGPQPPNVHVERYIPQSLLLPRCARALMHGGYNSVMSALAAGVPVIVIPQGADQPMNAEACAKLGIARVVTPKQLTPEFIRQQVREMLKEPTYRDRARQLQAEARALPGMEHGVALLEQLAREKRV